MVGIVFVHVHALHLWVQLHSVYNLTVETFLLMFKGFHSLFVSQLSLTYIHRYVLTAYYRSSSGNSVIFDGVTVMYTVCNIDVS